MFDNVDEYKDLGLGERKWALQIAWMDRSELVNMGPPEKVLRLSADALAMLEQNSGFEFSLRRAAKAIKFLRPYLDVQPEQETPDE